MQLWGRCLGLCGDSSLITRLLQCAVFLYMAVLVYVVVVGTLLPVTSSFGTLLLVGILWGLYTTCLSMVLFSYHKASYSDPGLVPLGSEDSYEAASGSGGGRNGRNDTMSSAFCGSCNISIPKRAYHCEKCARCVLRFDHHNILLNKCIGRRNHKALMCLLLWGIAFLASSTVFLLFGLTLVIRDQALLAPPLPTTTGGQSAAFSPTPPATFPSWEWSATSAILIFFSVGFCTCLVFFALYQVYLISRNRTMREQEMLAAGEGFENFSLGSVKENFISVMGRPRRSYEWLLWLWPVHQREFLDQCNRSVLA